MSGIYILAALAVLACNFSFSTSDYLPQVSTSIEKTTDFDISTEDGIYNSEYKRCAPFLTIMVKRGAAYPGGHGDFSGVAKQSTFAALGSYGGFVGHGSKGSTAGGYGAGSGSNGLNAGGGITIAGALGSYGGISGHGGPSVISSGGFGNGGLLFGKI